MNVWKTRGVTAPTLLPSQSLKYKARSYARAAGKPALRHVSDSPDKVNERVEDFKNSSSCQPRNFVGNGQFTLDGTPVGRRKLPFPLNPYFEPVRPISDETKKQIYKLFKENASQWTPRALAESFSISIVRVEAILRLKALEAVNAEKGIAIQSDFVVGMEKMLDPITIRPITTFKNKGRQQPRQANREYEPIRETLVQGLNPFTQLLDEESHLTPEDAAQILHLEPYENIDKRLSVKANRIFLDKPPVSGAGTPVAQDAVLGGKNDFMIIDTSASSGKIMIRDREGKLLPATPSQVYLKKHMKPKKFSM